MKARLSLGKVDASQALARMGVRVKLGGIARRLLRPHPALTRRPLPRERVLKPSALRTWWVRVVRSLIPLEASNERTDPVL